MYKFINYIYKQVYKQCAFTNVKISETKTLFLIVKENMSGKVFETKGPEETTSPKYLHFGTVDS